ncbi:hypothetical protein AHV57_25060 [Salmonella enterica]|nr:hypothetical protein [Salmonella enterica]EBA4670483.1 hypothetical protein [Salmonella enterica]
MKKTLFILLLACLGYLSVPEINASPLTPHAIQVTDQNQREVVIAQPPQRIITFVIPLASTIMAIDGSPGRLVGIRYLTSNEIAELRS